MYILEILFFQFIAYIALQVDIFHPLAQISWKECSPLPDGVRDAPVVTFNDHIFVGGGRSLPLSRSNAKIFISSTNLNSWISSTTPSSMYGLATHNSKLVLVGGRETETCEITDKLWVSDDGVNWEPSLPPMPTARRSPSAIDTSRCLVVAGGMGSDKSILDVVEVLSQEQWVTVSPLPMQLYNIKSTIHDNDLYFVGQSRNENTAFRCKLDALIAACSNTVSSTKKTTKFSPLWTKFDNSDYNSFVSFEHQLISVGGCTYCTLTFSSKICAFSTYTQSWTQVGNVPVESNNSTVTVLPTGEIAVIGGLHIVETGGPEAGTLHKSTCFSCRVFKGSLRGGKLMIRL